MPRVLVNGVEHPVEKACNHWRDLLDVLDERANASGEVVTAIRFDDVEEPAFREEAVLDRGLQSLKVITVDTATPQQLVRETVDEAVEAAGVLAAAADRVGASFRGYGVEEARQGLIELAQGLGTMLAIAQALSEATGIALAQLAVGGTSASDLVNQLTHHADTLIEARESSDWITVADIIEYDVAPHIRQWPAVFHAFVTPAPPA